jgi:immune inhibitor A
MVVLALVAGGARPAGAVRSRGELPVLFVLARFPHRPLAHERSYFVGGPDALVDRFVAYWTEVSAGRLRVVPTVGAPVVTLPDRRATYVQQPARMARDALAAFAAAATAPADREALARAAAVIVFFAGPGRESHPNEPDPPDPWSNYVTLVPPAEVAGRAFSDACVIAEEELPPFSVFGVLCHEFGHMLGLPELYAPGGAHEGIGVWGLMGQGTWLGKGDRPPAPSAWSRLRLGWADVETVDGTRRGVELPSASSAPRVVKIPADPEVPEEYYLLENRTRTGVDAALPGEGLLVWHVDDRVRGFRSSQQDARHPRVRLVAADGRNDLERGHAHGGNRGDAGDPWRGPPRWRRLAGALLTVVGGLAIAFAILRGVRPRPLWGVVGRLLVAAAAFALATPLRHAPVCGPGTPGMAPYGGGPSRVVIRNLSPPGPVMRFDVLVAPAPARD